MGLEHERCEPCRAGASALRGEALNALASQLPTPWRVVEEHHLERSFEFPDFARGLAFVNAVGELAEREGHHPDLLLRWGSVTVTLWTHSADGLCRADFVLAAKIERLRTDGATERL